MCKHVCLLAFGSPAPFGDLLTCVRAPLAQKAAVFTHAAQERKDLQNGHEKSHGTGHVAQIRGGRKEFYNRLSELKAKTPPAD